MIKRTTYTFDLPMSDSYDSAEFYALVHAVRHAIERGGAVDGEAIKSNRFQITVEVKENE